MAEYIKKEDIEQKIQDGLNNLVFGHDAIEVLGMIYEMPAADVAPVRHGRWLGEGDGYADGEIVFDVWHCSECDYCIDDGTDDPSMLPDFCPNCGTKIDEGKV